MATSVSGLNCKVRHACLPMSVIRGSANTILAPRLAAFFIHVAATGWFVVGLEPMTKIRPACSTSLTWLLTAAEPTPSNSAATLEAWHKRVQWSTLLEPKPVRTNFWNKYASSLLPLAEPKPAKAFLPCVSRKSLSLPPAKARASSHVASRNTSDQSAASRLSWSIASGSLGTPGLRISGMVKR